MESDDLSFCLNRTAQQCWGEIVSWCKGHHEIPAVRELTKSCGNILKTAELARVGPVQFMKLVMGVVAHIDSSEHFVVFCVVRIVQEYCTGHKTSTVIEPLIIAFVEQLLFYLHKDHPAEDIKNIFGSVTDVISWLLLARPHRLEAYLQFLLETVCSAETPLEVGRVVLSFVNERLERLGRDQRSPMRCSLQPHLSSLLQLLHDCGDYDVQAMVVECFFRLSTRGERPELAAQWLPTEELRRAFLGIANFDPDCRLLLNGLNQQQGAQRRVHSFPAESVLLAKYQLQKPSDPTYRHLWVDFNEGSGMVLLYCQQPITDTQADDSLWVTVMIYRRDVLRARLRLEANTQTLRLTLNCSCRELLNSAALDDCNGNVVTMAFTKEHSLHSVLGRLYGNVYKFQACESLGSGRQKCSEGIQAVPCRPAAAASVTASASVGATKASVPVSGISVSRSTSAPGVAAAETPGRRSDAPKSSVVSAPQRVSGVGRGRSPAGRYRQREMSSPGAELRRPDVTATPAESAPVSQSSAGSVIQPSQSRTVAPTAPRTPSAASKPTTPRSDFPQKSKPRGSQVVSQRAAVCSGFTGRESGRGTQEQLLVSGDEDGGSGDAPEREPAGQDGAASVEAARGTQPESGAVPDLASSLSDEEAPPPGQSLGVLSSQQGHSLRTQSSQQVQSQRTQSSQQVQSLRTQSSQQGHLLRTQSSQQGQSLRVQPSQQGQSLRTQSSQQVQSLRTQSSQEVQPQRQSLGTQSSQQVQPPGQSRRSADAQASQRPNSASVTAPGRQRRERSAAQREPLSTAAETGESAGAVKSASGGDGDARAAHRRRGVRPQYCELSSPDGEGDELILTAGTQRAPGSDLNNNNVCHAAAPKLDRHGTQRNESRQRGHDNLPTDQRAGSAGSMRNEVEKKPRPKVKTKPGRRGAAASPKKARKWEGKKANASRLRLVTSSSTESAHFWSQEHHMAYSETETETSAPRLRVRKRARTSRSPHIFSDIDASTVSGSQRDPPDTKGNRGTFSRHPAEHPNRLRNKELLTQEPARHDTKPPRGRGRGSTARKCGRGAVTPTGTWTSRVQRSPLRSPETLRDEPAPRTSGRAAVELAVSPQSKRCRAVPLAVELDWQSEEEATQRPGAQKTPDLQLDVIPTTDETALVPDPTSAVAAGPEVAAAAAEISVSLRESAPSVLCPPNTPAAASASAPQPAAALPADSPPRSSTQEFLLDARAGGAEPPDTCKERAAGEAAHFWSPGAALASAPAAELSHPEQFGAASAGDSVLGTVAAVRRELADLDRQDSDLLQLQRRSAAALQVLLEQQTAALATLQQLSAAAATARERVAERVLAECQRLEEAAAATDQPAELPLQPAHGVGELADIQRELLRLQRHLR